MKRQTPKNSTNLRQIEGGKTIKQNDRSSTFAYKLLDEYGEIIPALEGKRATIALVNKLESEELKTAYETTATVEEGQVEFTITETLEPGKYFVEVLCKGYIFPSTNTVTIEVTKSNFGKTQVETEAEETHESETFFEEIVIEDNTLYIGEEVVDREGENGLSIMYWDENMHTFLTKEVIKEPIDRIVRRGTKPRD